MAKHKVDKTTIHCLISRELKDKFNEALDRDGRTLTDVFVQLIKSYIQGGELVDKFIQMELEIQKLKLHQKRLESRLYQVNKFIYKLVKSGQLDQEELDAIEFDLLNPKKEQGEQNGKRKRGRPRKVDQLAREKAEREEKLAEQVIENATPDVPQLELRSDEQNGRTL